MNPRKVLGEAEYGKYKKAHESLSKEISELQGVSVNYILTTAIKNKMIERIELREVKTKEKPECETLKSEHARWSNLATIFFKMAAEAKNEEESRVFERAARSASNKAKQYYELYLRECKRTIRMGGQKRTVCCGPYNSPYPNFAHFPIVHPQTVSISFSEVIEAYIDKLHITAPSPGEWTENAVWIRIWSGKEGNVDLLSGNYRIYAIYEDTSFASLGNVKACVIYEF